MNKLLSTLNEYTLLNTLQKDYLEASLQNKAMKILNYCKDEIIHFDGDHCSSIEIILDGQVIIDRIDESGDLLTITVFHSDDILGGNLVFSKNPHYPMTVTAKTDTSLLSIQKDLLFQLCSVNTDFLRRYLEYISDHTILLGDKIKHYVNRSIRESLIAYLKNEYLIQNTTKILLNTSKKAIADRIGVQRTSLSRELQKMKNEGLIAFDSLSVTVLDLNILK